MLTHVAVFSLSGRDWDSERNYTPAVGARASPCIRCEKMASKSLLSYAPAVRARRVQRL